MNNIHQLSKVRHYHQQPPEPTAAISDVPKFLINRGSSYILHTLGDPPDSEYNVFRGKRSYRYVHGAEWFYPQIVYAHLHANKDFE